MAHSAESLKLYEGEKARAAYIEETMPRTTRMFRRLAKEDVRAVLRNIASRTGRSRIRILSLGCGPGSDLLGILGAVDSALRKGIGESAGLRCRCTGVDALNWNLDVFNEQVKALGMSKDSRAVRCRFVCEDMWKFVCDSSSVTGLIEKEFDFICLSFVDTEDNLQLIGAALPQLLSEFGRVLVLDNDIPPVRSLTGYGFTCSFAGDGVCMLRRSQLHSTGFYQPPANSPVMLDKLRALLEEWSRLYADKWRISLENELDRLQLNRTGVLMPPLMLREWKNASSKEELRLYVSEVHRSCYIKGEMNRKTRAFGDLILDHVKEVLGDVRGRDNRAEIRILSLGCGPGSDLLALLRTVEAVLTEGSVSGLKRGELRCHCTGVDAFDWDWSFLERRVDQLRRGRRFREIALQFVCQDMEIFVHDRSTASGLIADKFDFICLSFADAGRNLLLIGTALPQLLSEFGRVLVLDRDIPRVRSLARFGFELEACNDTCLLSRGQATQPLRQPYKPSRSSAIQLFRLHQEAADLMEKMRLHVKRVQ